MSKHQHQVLSRGQLLDAISQPGSVKNDRNIDFLINRLRRKLGDKADDPQFIQTRYGEGYIGLAGLTETQAEVTDATVIVGPLRGLENLGKFRANGTDFAKQIHAAIVSETEVDHLVAWLPNHSNLRDSRRKLVVELTFIRDENQVECVVCARSLPMNRIVRVSRHPIGIDAAFTSEARRTAQAIAPVILAKYWDSRVSDVAIDNPLPVAIWDPTTTSTNGPKSWPASDKRLRLSRRLFPDDPALKMQYATNLHSKYVLLGSKLFRENAATCEQDEAEIERLVLESLEFAQLQPDYSILAAKLLYFVDRGYRDIAAELAETGYKNHTTISSSLAVVGQLRMFLGQTEAAVSSLKQAAGLSEHGSMSHVYSLVLLCQAHQAVGDSDALEGSRKELYKLVPKASIFFDLVFSDPEKPTLRAKAAALMMSKSRARSHLMYSYYISARLFERQEHRENALRTPLGLFQRRFGPSVVPAPVAELVPNLLV